jgi:outer membrane lipoprotein-sorting protein
MGVISGHAGLSTDHKLIQPPRMIPSPLRFLAVFGTLALCAAPLFGQTAILAKARAYLGPDVALDAVTSVHYAGKVTASDTTDPTKKSTSTIDIIFQKPDRHRMTVTSGNKVEITALDGYEGWQRFVMDTANPAGWKQALATPDQIKRLRANTWENVSFFRGIESRGGRIEVLQPTTIEGISCHKVAFIYGPNIIFYRYFDQATGKLVLTETEAGTTIKEEGEIVVNGIRFPKSIVTTQKNAAKPVVVSIVFDEIKLNEKFPDDTFAVPALTRQ